MSYQGPLTEAESQQVESMGLSEQLARLVVERRINPMSYGHYWFRHGEREIMLPGLNRLLKRGDDIAAAVYNSMNMDIIGDRWDNSVFNAVADAYLIHDREEKPRGNPSELSASYFNPFEHGKLPQEIATYQKQLDFESIRNAGIAAPEDIYATQVLPIARLYFTTNPNAGMRDEDVDLLNRAAPRVMDIIKAGLESDQAMYRNVPVIIYPTLMWLATRNYIPTSQVEELVKVATAVTTDAMRDHDTSYEDKMKAAQHFARIVKYFA
jgi:hypothetical protein